MENNFSRVIVAVFYELIILITRAFIVSFFGLVLMKLIFISLYG